MMVQFVGLTTVTQIDSNCQFFNFLNQLHDIELRGTDFALKIMASWDKEAKTEHATVVDSSQTGST